MVQQAMVAGRIRLVRLIGAFVIAGAALMVLTSTYKLLWVADIANRQINLGETSPVQVSLDNVLVNVNLKTFGESLGLLLPPIAGVMFWAGLLTLGVILYKFGELTVPARPPEARRRKR